MLRGIKARWIQWPTCAYWLETGSQSKMATCTNPKAELHIQSKMLPQYIKWRIIEEATWSQQSLHNTGAYTLCICARTSRHVYRHIHTMYTDTLIFFFLNTEIILKLKRTFHSMARTCVILSFPRGLSSPGQLHPFFSQSHSKSAQ